MVDKTKLFSAQWFLFFTGIAVSILGSLGVGAAFFTIDNPGIPKVPIEFSPHTILQTKEIYLGLVSALLVNLCVGLYVSKFWTMIHQRSSKMILVLWITSNAWLSAIGLITLFGIWYVSNEWELITDPEIWIAPTLLVATPTFLVSLGSIFFSSGWPCRSATG